MARPGWERSGPASKTGGYWRHESGAVIAHCGHPTALYAYEAWLPSGDPAPAFNSRWHRTLRDAIAAIEFLLQITGWQKPIAGPLFDWNGGE